MASKAECLIIVLDVRQCADDDFKRKAVKTAAEILKEKICDDRSDYVSFVLVGTESTNSLKESVSSNCRQHITEYPVAQCPTWNLLMQFYKFVSAEACNEGEWLDGLVVAMDKIQKAQDHFKVVRNRILLFYDFNAGPNDHDSFDEITTNLVKSEIELIVVCKDIEYIDNAENGQPQAVFPQSPKKAHQLENEKFVLRLVPHCNALISNFKEVVRTVYKINNKRPWCWNNTLSIGTKIVIKVAAIIAIKEESHIKIKPCWTAESETLSRELRTYIKGEEVDAETLNLTTGYMLGGTPIVYDEELMDPKEPLEPGIRVMGFVKRNSLHEEYFCGDVMYYLVAQKAAKSSAKKFSALVEAMRAMDMALFCWRVYSVKFNTPKIMVLLPNDPSPDMPASMSMIEMSFYSQHNQGIFPSLKTSSTECQSAQLEAIDELMDAMDLSIPYPPPRKTASKTLLPFDMLPHIFEQNIMDILERKILSNASETDEQFQEMLADKNFVDVFWRLPEEREEAAKRAAGKLEKLFPLERRFVPIAKSTHKAKQDLGDKDDIPRVPLKFTSVGKQTPAEDFEQLLKHNVIAVRHKTLRDAEYHKYAGQMQQVILDLLEATPLESEQVSEALKVYRKSCFDFNAVDAYNKWLLVFKAKTMERKLYDFWRDYVMEKHLGYAIVGDVSLEEAVKVTEFYNMDEHNNNAMETEEVTDAAVHALLKGLE